MNLILIVVNELVFTKLNFKQIQSNNIDST